MSLRALLEQRRALVIPGAYDALTASLIEEAGFEALSVAGSPLTLSRLGLPDHGFLALDDVVQAVRAIRRVVSIPVLCDADTGFGGPEQVAHTVRELQSAGASGLHIEDQEFPKQCSYEEGRSVVATEAMVEKIAAGVAARGSDFVILARCDALPIEGIDGLISRARDYVSAGADGLLVADSLSPAQVRTVAEAVDTQVVYCSRTTGLPEQFLSQDLYAEVGAAAVLLGLAPAMAATRAVRDLLAHVRSSGLGEESYASDHTVPFDDYTSVATRSSRTEGSRDG